MGVCVVELGCNGFLESVLYENFDCLAALGSEVGDVLGLDFGYVGC